MTDASGRTHAWHRETARVILTRPDGRILLLLTHFESRVGLPPRWITPGGGIDDGETIVDAAIRELREETGLMVNEGDLGELIAAIPGTWDWPDGETYHSYVDHFYSLVVDDFELDTSGWTESELHDVLDIRWWTLDELRAEDPFLGPPELLGILDRLA